jgi:hypothetical protein
VASVFGSTGEQFDPETDFTFLRTRYLDPRLQRILSAESPLVRNDLDYPRRLTIEERPVSTGEGALRLELPPHSVSVLLLV